MDNKGVKYLLPLHTLALERYVKLAQDERFTLRYTQMCGAHSFPYAEL